MKAVVVEELKEEGFGVKITDGGVIAHLGSRTPSRHEIVDAVPELEGVPMKRVKGGVFIQVGEEPFSLREPQEATRIALGCRLGRREENGNGMWYR